MHNDNEVLVKVEGVSKKFCRSLKRSLFYGICDIFGELSPFGGRSPVPRLEVPGSSLENEQTTIAEGANQNSTFSIQHSKFSPTRARDEDLRPGEFYAVRDVSFELKRGECLGLIGRNGAGKTTLLKMLNGLIKPDSGYIAMRGRVGALIALGAGFNPILTGRENIYVYGSVLGLKKAEIDERFDDIVDFAEISEFIDAPVQSYSSGMQVRLGFAVATAMDPDVLILDEVLAVGDAAFRNKCYERVGRLLSSCAVILVTHNMSHISRVCSRVLLLKSGRSFYQGETGAGISYYDDLNATSLDDVSGALHLTRPVIEGSFEILKKKIVSGEKMQIRLDLLLEEKLKGAYLLVMLYDSSYFLAAQWFSNHNGMDFSLAAGKNQFTLSIGPMNLRKGAYVVSALIKDEAGIRQVFWSEKQQKIIVESPYYAEAAYQISGWQ